MRSLRLGVLLSVAVWGAGCGPAEPVRVPVGGTVTLDGKPLEDGLIYFKTAATGVIDTAEIKDGKFEGRAEPGERRVEITSLRTVTTEATPGMKTETQENLIPPEYNAQSTLTADVAEGAPPLTFDLKAR